MKNKLYLYYTIAKYMYFECNKLLTFSGHSKTKLIIYQGGNNGFYETVYHGVPSVVIPLLMDQYDVASRTVHHGMGVELDYHTLNADKIEDAVRTVLRNSR